MKSRAMKFVGGFLLFASAVYGGPVVARVYWGQDRAGWIDEPDRKQVSAVATDQPVKIDGVLNEVAWKQAAPLDDFLWLRRAIQQNIQKFANQAIGDVGAVPPTQKTVAGVLYDSNALYFGVECFEKDMKNIKMAEDNNSSFLWKDDCVEIFLDPTCSGSSYYHFVANAAGKTGRPRMSAPQQSDNTWQAAVTRTNDRWILEARIPFATLGVKPWRGSTWQLNIGREEQPLQEISSWSEMLVTFHEPSRFGRLIFGFENKIRMNLRVPSQYGVGVNKVAVRLT